MMRRQATYFFLVLLLAFQFEEGSAQSPNQKGFEIMKNLDIYSSLIKELNQDYVDEINPGDLTEKAIEAMLESLDPYTNFIPESQVEDYKFITTGQYGGIGSLIHQQGEYVVISEPYEGSPAQKSGMKAGDRIIEINGQKAKGKSYDEVSAILKGQAGTKVTLVFERDGEEQPLQKTITREIIKIENIPYYGMIEKNIGYIKLSGFTQNAARELRSAFLKLKENNNLNGIIIDLRGNGGGLLNEAVDIANIFVDRGQEIVSTRGKKADKNRSHLTTNPPVDVNIPIVIMVDRQSASASEILAGSMQDLDRGIVLGQRTFGKGLVQNVVPLSYNSQLKITVAKYYIPSGRCIQAIDYSHKAKDGSFSKIPDSLIRAFKTRNGRTVYDGGGIYPDILSESPKYSNLALTLYGKYYLFDFATQYAREHDSIVPAGTFTISDTIYNEFMTYLRGKEYSYSTRSEKALEALKKEAVKENYFNAISDEYDLLMKQMASDKKEDLNKYKNQIEELLKLEIVTRYYFQKGKIEAALQNDSQLKDAIAILNDREKYSAILSRAFTQPKPEIPINDGSEDDVLVK